MTESPRTLAFLNLGCSKNLVDGETMAAFCATADVRITERHTEADIIIVNTCTFIQEATRETIQAILEMARLKKAGRCTQLIVAGCFSQRYRHTVATQFPEVDHWIGLKDWERKLRRILHLPGNRRYHRILSKPIATQYLKIAEGCSHRCSFCIIPRIKGPYTSRKPDTILAEAQWLARKGVKECILVAQDTSFYGRDMGTSLPELIELLLKKTDFRWIRMLYLHPRHITTRLLHLIGSEGRVCSYFDIPLQHIAPPILASMQRTPRSEHAIRTLIETIRRTVPDATIRTSFILGYPQETNAHFKQLLSFIEWARLDKVGVFPFSPEEGTPAYGMAKQPAAATAQRRCELVMDLQREISRELLEKKVGATEEIIIDGKNSETGYPFEGRTRGDAPEIDGRVHIRKGKTRFKIGDFIQATMVKASDYDLYAEEG